MYLSLNGEWKLYYFMQDSVHINSVRELAEYGVPSVSCRVPGNVELDLSAAGILPRDLFKGMNIREAENFEGYEWWYEKNFVPEKPADNETVALVFEAVDCFADYYLNGVKIGSSDNMFIENRFDVTDILAFGRENTLHVNIKSALAKASEIPVEPDSLLYTSHISVLSVNIRKAPHSFGWDIMPRALSAGIWRGVGLSYESIYRFRSVYCYVDNFRETTVSAKIAYDCFAGHENSFKQLKTEMSAKCGDFEFTCEFFATYPNGILTFDIPRNLLWMPKNYGKPHMFDLELTVYNADGVPFINKKFRQGFRTAELIRTDTICKNGCFEFHINGIKVFALGSNWVPLDAYHSRDKEKYAAAIALAEDAGCNILRCWGGNVYEDTEFYDLCDERGIMVWQDFAMACHFYPQTTEFAEMIKKEITSVVQKLRNHPSIVLWAGDNEVDQIMNGKGYKTSLNRLTREVIPPVLERLDPKRSYIASSPYICDEVAAMRENGRPEDHLWGPRDYYKSDYYKESRAYFVSETGYHGCPARESIEKFIDSDRVWNYFDNEQWNLHSSDQVNSPDRVMLMHKQVMQLFGKAPESMDDYILASQISQAEAKKYFIERVRIRADRMGGVIWWNLLDGWPQMSDAVVDYYGTKKLAYEYIRRSSQPVAVMLDEQSSWGHDIVISNIGGADVIVEYKITDALSGKTKAEGKIISRANSVIRNGKIPVMYSEKGMFFINYTVDGRELFNTYLYGSPVYDLEIYKKLLAMQNL